MQRQNELLYRLGVFSSIYAFLIHIKIINNHGKNYLLSIHRKLIDKKCMCIEYNKYKGSVDN